MDTRATKHIVQDRVDFMNFHIHLIGSQIVVLGNDCEEDVVKLRTYHLMLHEGAMLLLHNALHAPGVRCSFLSFISESSLLFNFPLVVLDIVYHGDLFGHATLKSVFNVMDKIEQLPSLLHF